LFVCECALICRRCPSLLNSLRPLFFPSLWVLEWYHESFCACVCVYQRRMWLKFTRCGGGVEGLSRVRCLPKTSERSEELLGVTFTVQTHRIQKLSSKRHSRHRSASNSLSATHSYLVVHKFVKLAKTDLLSNLGLT
jgi:hypothetical protein